MAGTGTRTSPRTAGLQPIPGLSSPRRGSRAPTGNSRRGSQGNRPNVRTVSTEDRDLGPEDSHETHAPRNTSSGTSGSNDGDVPAQLVGLPLGGKPSRKNITIPAFSGRVDPGAVDSGVRKWWRQFTDQLTDAQVFDGHRWSDLQQRSVLSGSLCDLAADWFIRVKQDNPGLTMAEAGDRLIRQFSSPLGENVLRKTLTESKKRRTETYMEYASRLLDIADSLPGGSGLESNGRQAVYAFIEHAHPAFEKDLERLARKKFAKGILAGPVLDMVVTELVALAKSNGQAEPFRPRFTQKRGASNYTVEQPAKRRKGTDDSPTFAQKEKALAVIVDRTAKQARAGKPRWKVTAKTRCYECNGYGHISRDCSKRTLAGTASAALANDQE